MACADDVTPGPPKSVDDLDPAGFDLPPEWEATVWTDGLLLQRSDVGTLGVMEFPDYPGEFYVTYFSNDQRTEFLTGPFPNAVTAVAFLELTKT